jgi:sarcosine oxidase/L-pipecolate oxidase
VRRFLPVAGRCMANVLSGEGNGEERDRAWRWKSEAELARREAKEFGNSPGKRVRHEFSDFEDGPKAKI